MNDKIDNDIQLKKIYNEIKNNLPKIKELYGDILNPSTNSLTQKFIDKGNDNDTAYILSFMSTFLIGCNVSDINLNLSW